ncbi:MAG: hypothetical protein sL5_06450 [Candidatus Mesenet longicola]|uniref:Uncharacterized protein n=1 Tax=Candidatus Mesenet longicola TaxID=1892558 RepID=A0A8J3MQK5_9RICK|nr:MAG: hypothetical protein sGL2_06440 [Candidatus Mesenet longicola]GHM59652.1 MAG: hypothetical protein sL5_06450 [Candidatus Mesenet longicola]
MLYNNTQKHDDIESTTIKLQLDKNTEDSGISEGDSDSIGKPVNEPKTNSAIKKPKTKTHKNNSAGESSRELKVKEGYVLVEKTCHEAGKKLDEIHLKNTRNTSEELKKCKEECDDLLNTAAGLKSKTDSAKKATELVTTSINNHEKLLKNNNSKSKCMGAGGVLGSTGGTIVIIAGAGASNPIIAGAVIFIGSIIAFCFAGMAVSGFYNLYKKPNSAVESIDIEQGMHKNCKGLLSSIT